MIGLAPLEESFAKQATQKPTVATAPAKSPAGDSDLGLVPLEGSAAQASKTAAAPASKPAAPSDGAAKPATPPAKVDDSQRIVCPKCGTKMRLPPNAAGKQVVCPKCKNKQRVPEAAAVAEETKKTLTNMDTIALSDTPASSQDLGGGMLDMLGDGAAASVDAEAGSPAGLASPKLSGGKSKGGNKLLGMPPIAVYGGAAGITALVIGLILVVVLSGPSANTTAITPPPQIAQAPAPSPTTPPGNPTPAASMPPAQPLADNPVGSPCNLDRWGSTSARSTRCPCPQWWLGRRRTSRSGSEGMPPWRPKCLRHRRRVELLRLGKPRRRLRPNQIRSAGGSASRWFACNLMLSRKPAIQPPCRSFAKSCKAWCRKR